MEDKETSTENPAGSQEQKGPHQAILRLMTKLFGKPYLSFGLILFFGLVVLTEFAYRLMNQPSVYWLDHSQGLKDSQFLFGYGPWVALGIYLVYILIMGAVLSLLNRSPALVVWCAAVYVPLNTFSRLLPVCGSGVFKIFPDLYCNIYQSIVLLVIGLILGFALVGNLLQVEASESRMAGRGWLKTKLGLSVLGASMIGVWFLLLAVGIFYSARIPTTGWQPVQVVHSPSPRYEMMVAYDSGRDKTVLFGGVVETSGGNWSKTAETWEWSGKDWTQIRTEISPPARSRGAMAYDKTRGMVILFGGWNDLGKSLGDTWGWDGNTWTKFCSSCNPPPRGCFDMFYDPSRKQVVLYGGCDDNGNFYNDAWEWNGVDWDRIDQTDSPLISGAPLIYDPQNQRAVGFLAGFPTGTWIWDDQGWSKLTSPSEPPGRANAALSFNPMSGQILMFGGQNDKGKSLYNDTWLLNDTTWSEVKSGLQPPGRWGHVVFFDPSRGKFMLFGGFGRSALNDMWEFTFPGSK